MNEERTPWPKPKGILKSMRIGDKVASVAQPVAKVADKLLRTDIQNCKKCKKRKAFLNGE